MIAEAASVVDYEARVRRFKPEQGLAATNSNDLRRLLYEWFTHFEHAAPAEFYLDHIAGENLLTDTAGWQSRSDSCLCFIRQTWTITVADRPVIKTLVAAGGDTPSPIAE